MLYKVELDWVPKHQRIHHSLAKHPNYKIYMFGGQGSDRKGLNLTEYFDITSYQWEEVKQRGVVPNGRWGHSSVVINDYLYVIGGTDNQDLEPCQDIMFWMYIDLGEWKQVESWAGIPPTNLIFHRSVVLDSWIITVSPTDELVTQLSIFETETLHWMNVKTSQAVDYWIGCSMLIYQPVDKNQMLIVFGGKNKNDYVVIDEMDIKDGEHVKVPDP